ncbi:hypothetical protein PIB30_069601, partial [Stylosanthes scabra]|nr:hypothetical protein [Stylosanthes scabra]
SLKKSILMALLGSSHLNNKNELIPLSDKLDDNNYPTWKKSVLLILRTLKLQNHLSHDKIPPQFDPISTKEAEPDPNTAKKNVTEGESKVAEKKDPSSDTTTLQESDKFLEWVQNDCALMTWLDASITLSYKNWVVHCATFAEA